MRDNEAREIADLVKNGQTDEVGRKLGEEFEKHMKAGDFQAFLKQVQAENAKDVAANKDLPVLKITSGDSGVEVDISTPGKYMGNLWRDTTMVFADVKNGQFQAKDRANIIAERDSEVIAYDHSRVNAKAGSKIDAGDNAQVMAEDGSDVFAVDHSQVIAEEGSTVFAEDTARVTKVKKK